MTIAAQRRAAAALAASRPGYNQNRRWAAVRKTDAGKLTIVPGGAVDCSSSSGIIAVLGGYPVNLSNPFWTGNLAARFKAAGFDVIRVSGIRTLAALVAKLRGGDHLLGPGHVVYCDTPRRWWSAENDERGKSTGGKDGLQRGERVGWREPYMRSRGWAYILRPRSLSTWRARALVAIGKGRTTDLAYARKILAVRSTGMAWARWDAFLDDFTALNRGMVLDYTARALSLADAEHAFVVLGSALKADGSLPVKYRRRLDLAAAAAQLNPTSRVVLSGGKARGGITEAAAGQAYLLGLGVDPSRIVLEEDSSSTVGNASHTVPLLVSLGIGSYTLVSAASHLRRAAVLFAAADTREAAGLSRLTPLAYNDYAPARVKTEGPVDANTRATIASEAAAVLNLTTFYVANT